MSVFQDFLISLRDYRRYPELLKNGKRRVFAFAALLIFLAVLAGSLLTDLSPAVFVVVSGLAGLAVKVWGARK